MIYFVTMLQKYEFQNYSFFSHYIVTYLLNTVVILVINGWLIHIIKNYNIIIIFKI